MTTTSSFGPAFAGWHAYGDFAGSVEAEARFVRTKTTESFLDEVRASCASRMEIIPKDSLFWRARLGCETEQITTPYPDITVVTEEERPYGRDGMKPIPNWNGEGRANPRGIPVLYMANTRDTALAEVRPWIGARISVAQLATGRELKIVDCSKNHAKESMIGLFDDPGRPRVDGIWVAIDRAFAAPVSKEDEARDYVPTQVLAELFKAEGYDGLAYKSLLSDDGLNIALFNLDDAHVVHCSLYRVDEIGFKFSETGVPAYFK